MDNGIKRKLDEMTLAGHPILTLGNTVSLPEEAEDYFTPDERKKILDYVQAQIKNNSLYLSAESDEEFELQ